MVHDVERHPHGRVAFFGWVVVYLFVLQTIAQVAVVRIEYGQSSGHHNSEPLGRAAKMVADLPAGGKRLLQTATGYRATIVSGVVTFENGAATGALPGRLLRSAPNAFTPVLAAA